MPKTKNLKGLSYNLAQSYFSTLNYFIQGYMADWIVNCANEIGADRIKIDIINKTVFPEVLTIKPLIANLDILNYTIRKTLKSNDLKEDFITRAILEINILSDRQIVCSNFIVDKTNKIYKSKDFTEKSYELFSVKDWLSQSIIPDLFKSDLINVFGEEKAEKIMKKYGDNTRSYGIIIFWGTLLKIFSKKNIKQSITIKSIILSIMIILLLALIIVCYA